MEQEEEEEEEEGALSRKEPSPHTRSYVSVTSKARQNRVL